VKKKDIVLTCDDCGCTSFTDNIVCCQCGLSYVSHAEKQEYLEMVNQIEKDWYEFLANWR
jgi:hypothetical protein